MLLIIKALQCERNHGALTDASKVVAEPFDQLQVLFRKLNRCFFHNFPPSALLLEFFKSFSTCELTLDHQK